MIKWFARRYALSLVNDALESIKDKEQVNVWKAKIQKILDFLQTLMKALDDNQISQEEADQIVDGTKKLFE